MDETFQSVEVPSGSSLPLALHIIPSTLASQDHIATMEVILQSIVLDRKHPVALELVGTPTRRSFVVRANSQASLDHVEVLLRGRYPQIDIEPLRTYDDPFRLDRHEAVSALELVGGASPDNTSVTTTTSKIDPLPGLLAALTKIPEHSRAVIQIGLVPSPYQNFVMRFARRSLRASRTPYEDLSKEPTKKVSKLGLPFYADLGAIVLLNVILVLFLYHLAPAWFPTWLFPMFIRSLTGKPLPGLSIGQVQQLMWLSGGLALSDTVIFSAIESGRRYLRAAIDPDLLAAYRARVRVYVIGPRTSLGRQVQTSVASSASSERMQTKAREDVLLRLAAAYRQMQMIKGVYFMTRRISATNARRLVITTDKRSGWTNGLLRSRTLLPIGVLATLWHMPPAGSLPELALGENRSAHTLLIPPDVVRDGEGLIPVGHSVHGGYRLPFGFSPQFFSYHTIIIGKSSEGKSAFMRHLARDAMLQGGGLMLIDPYGDLCEQALRMVPANRAEDVVLIDLSDTSSFVGLNPLDVMLGQTRDKAITGLLKMLSHLWSSTWNPRMENAFEMSLRTLFEANKVLVATDPVNGPRQQHTLLDVIPLLTNANFCHALLQQIQDDYLHRWWHEYYEPLSLIQQRDVINPVVSQVSKFENVVARRIVGQGASTLNLSKFIREQKIILLNLARGVVGGDVATLIGSTLLGLIQVTLEEQGRSGRLDRFRLPIILDEFQMVFGTDYKSLAELYKYGATFFLATKSLDYLRKMSPRFLPTIQANVRQTVVFQSSTEDALLLQKEMGVSDQDILNLDLASCYVSVLAANRRQPTFSVKVDPIAPGDELLAESIRTRCRVRYTYPVDEVDEMLREAMLRGIRMVPTAENDANVPSTEPNPFEPQPTLETAPNPFRDDLPPTPSEALDPEVPLVSEEYSSVRSQPLSEGRHRERVSSTRYRAEHRDERRGEPVLSDMPLALRDAETPVIDDEELELQELHALQQQELEGRHHRHRYSYGDDDDDVYDDDDDDYDDDDDDDYEYDDDDDDDDYGYDDDGGDDGGDDDGGDDDGSQRGEQGRQSRYGR